MSWLTCVHAAANRPCHIRSCWLDAGSSLGRGGSISAATTTTGRSSCQPKPVECSATYCSSPARPRNTSRRKSPWYLFSTAVTACSRVISSAATAAARSRACTSAFGDRRARAVADQPGQVGATGGHPEHPHLPGPHAHALGAHALDPQATGRVQQVRGRQRRRGRAGVSAAARSRPSVDVNSTPSPSTLATSAAIWSRLPPSSTIWVSAVCRASIRASSALASSEVIKTCASFP